MGKTFQEQMLALGLVEKKRVNDAKKQKHKQKKQQSGKKQVVVDENAILAMKAQEKKKERARQLNQQREEKLQKREEAARIKQLIETHRLEKDEKGSPFRFNAGGKIQRIFVTGEMAAQLGNGSLGIVRLADQYEVVPRNVIEKIQAINEKVFVSLASKTFETEPDPDDPYAEYKVPDDLMW